MGTELSSTDISFDTIRVLHVDDEPDFADLTGAFLQREDDRFSIETATRASEGLDCLADERFECVISDYDMPGQNGVEFLKRVREDHPNLPFILFTGKGSEEVASEAISAGVTDYLQKGTGQERYTLLANRITNAVTQARTHQELRRTERQYQAIFNDPNILVGLIDTDGTVLDINDTAMEYIDAEIADVTGQPFWNSPWFSHSNAVQQDVRDWIERAASGEYVEFEVDLGQSDGEPYTVEGVFRPVTNEEGDVVSLLISDRDITERKETQRQLRETKERYQRILNHMSDYVLIVDDSGEISYVSPAIEDVTGYAPGEVIGTNAFEYVHPEDQGKAVDAFGQTLANPDQEVSVEYRTTTKDGSYRGIEVRGGNYLDDPVIEGVMVSVRDISDRKDH